MVCGKGIWGQGQGQGWEGSLGAESVFFGIFSLMLCAFEDSFKRHFPVSRPYTISITFLSIRFEVLPSTFKSLTHLESRCDGKGIKLNFVHIMSRFFQPCFLNKPYFPLIFVVPSLSHSKHPLYIESLVSHQLCSISLPVNS